HPRIVQELDRAHGDERCLLCGFCDRAVARSERRGDLTREDREREIPGTDTDERASPSQPELVALARRPREAKTLVELRPCSARVVAQEVDRLAHLGDAVDDR